MTGRVIPAAVNWAQLLKQTAPADKKLMAAFKIKSDVIAGNYAKAAAFNRTINWAHYEKNIDNKDLVAEFKSKFQGTEIPVPSDEGLATTLEARAASDAIAVDAYVKKVDGQIDDASVTLNNINALPPFEQMTRADILYWFPQLCPNQEWSGGSENVPTVHIRPNHAQFNELGWFEHEGTLKAHFDRQKEKNGETLDKNSSTIESGYRISEVQFYNNQYPAFFSSFPTEDFKESFALSDPLIKWEEIAHCAQFEAEVGAIQAAEGVQPGFRA